jgi:spore coat polysaccharide biosynthesis protein SpsF
LIKLNKNKGKVVASIEARMTSSRLPGKMLMSIGNKLVIQHLVDRLRECVTLDDIVIATTINDADDDLVSWAESYGVSYYRGSENDVLGRVVEAHKYMETDIIVEITGDCPFTDPDIVDIGVNTFLENDIDYLTNCEIFSAPPGLYVQVFTFETLAQIEKIIKDSAIREHVSLYYYENPDRYKVFHLMSSPKLKLPKNTRVYLDYSEDLVFLSEIYKYFISINNENFDAQDIVKLLIDKPELLKINSHLVDVPVRQA